MVSCNKSSLEAVFFNKHGIEESLKKDILNWTEGYIDNVNPDFMAVLDFSRKDILVFEKCFDPKLKCSCDCSASYLMDNVVESQRDTIRFIDNKLKEFAFSNKLLPRKCVFNLRFNLSFDKKETVTYVRSIIILSSDDKIQPELALVTIQDITKMTNYLQGTYFEIKSLGQSTASSDIFLKFEKKINNLIHPPADLTKRENQILQLLINGQTSQHISKELFIAKTTVDKHRQNLMRKFKVSNVTQLIRKYLQSVV